MKERAANMASKLVTVGLGLVLGETFGTIMLSGLTSVESKVAQPSKEHVQATGEMTCQKASDMYV